MNKPNPNRYVPTDWLWHIGMLVIIPCVALMASILLPIVSLLKTADVTTLYASGLAMGVIGVLILFIARLPLYRAGHLWTLGPRQLDRKHRCCYGFSYVLVAVSLLLLWIVWLRTS
jgi:hypothetical protein